MYVRMRPFWRCCEKNTGGYIFWYFPRTRIRAVSQIDVTQEMVTSFEGGPPALDQLESATSSSSSSSSESEESTTSRRRECVKYFIVIGVIVTMIVLSDEVGELLLSTRSFLSTIPLTLGIPLVILCSGFQRVLPPAHYILPLNTLSMLYLLSLLGVYPAAFIMSGVKLLDTVWFFAIRFLYSRIMSGGDEGGTSKCIPKDLLRALGVLDEGWGEKIKVRGFRGIKNMVVLGCAWVTDELVTLYFLCTRCDLTAIYFGCGWFATQTLLLPEQILRAFTLNEVTSSFTDWTALQRGFQLTPWWILLLWTVIAVSTTIACHAFNIKLAISECEEDSDDEDDDETASRSPSSVATGSRRSRNGGRVELTREERRAQIVAEQRNELVTVLTP